MSNVGGVYAQLAPSAALPGGACPGAHHCWNLPVLCTLRGAALRCAEEVLERDFFMSAEEARDFGLVDEVIEHRPKAAAEAEE